MVEWLSPARVANARADSPRRPMYSRNMRRLRNCISPRSLIRLCRDDLSRSNVTAKSYVDLSDVLCFIRHVGVLSAQCLQTVDELACEYGLRRHGGTASVYIMSADTPVWRGPVQ